MARKLKTQPSTKAVAPSRRGRKPKAAAPSPALPLVARTGNPAMDAAEAEASKSDPGKPLGRRGPGRKQKQRAEGDARVVRVVSPLDDAESGDAAQDGTRLDEVAPGSVPSSAAPAKAARTAPAARWDRATDAARFDWPEIERVASAAGPNQGMAKLLVAARAEGAGSRWPL